MFQQNSRPGDIYITKKARVMNRSGAAVAVGDVLALDMLGTDASTAAKAGVGGVTLGNVYEAIFHNAVAVAAGNIDGILCVVSSLLGNGGADDTQIEVTLMSQIVDCEVYGDTDIAIGDRLAPVAAQTYLVKLTDAADTRGIAFALEAYTDAAAVVKKVCFFGGVLAASLLGD